MLEAVAPTAWGLASLERDGDATLGAWWLPHEDPAVARRGGLTVVFDGCIYNRADFPETGTDADVVAGRIERAGLESTLQRINGDFALAVYDAGTQRLSLARDRFGLRPMYYARTSEDFAFASRMRALFEVPAVAREENPEFVALFAGSHYRTFDNDPQASPYRNIRQLPAGHLLSFGDGRIEVAPWWRLVERGDLEEDEETLAERYRALLLDAVRIRLERARRPAFTLSGGMDSSSVLACAVRHLGERQQAFSTAYEDATYDESEEIRETLDATVSQWHVGRIGNPDLLDVVPRMIAANDEPVATATWLSHYLLCEEAAREGVRDLFGGLGGDELNAGEYEHFFFFFADLAAAGDEARLDAETRKWIEYHDHPVFKKTFDVMRAGLKRLVDLDTPGRCLPDRARLMRYADAVRPEYFDLAAFEPEMDVIFPSYLKNRSYHDIFRETSPCCIRAADRQASAFGLGVIWPFFDHRVVEFMFAVPSRLKVRDGVTKHLLRAAMRGVLPEQTRTRVKKTGWNAPAHVWFSGPGREILLDIVGSQEFRERGIYHVDKVRAIIDEHEDIVSSGRVADNHMMFLWQLLNLELWLRANREARSGPPRSHVAPGLA